MKRLVLTVLLTACGVSEPPKGTSEPQNTPAETHEGVPEPPEASPPSQPSQPSAPEDAATPPPPDGGQTDAQNAPDAEIPPKCDEICANLAQKCGKLASDPSCDCGSCQNSEICAQGTCGTCQEQPPAPCANLVTPAYHHAFEATCPYLPASRKCVLNNGARCCE